MEKCGRRNLIIMGDRTHDAEIINENDYDNVLKIGFFNPSKDFKSTPRNVEIFEEFKQTFDMMIREDGSMESVNFVLEFLTNK